MAMTLAEMAKGQNDEVFGGILMQQAEQSFVLQNTPFSEVGDFVARQWTAEQVTESGFRSIGNSFQESTDDFKSVDDHVALMGNMIDIDTALKMPRNREIDPYIENINMQADRWRYTFHDTFINGDRNTSPDKFDGLQKRVDDTAGHLSDVKIGFDDDVSTSAKRQNLLDTFEQGEEEIADLQVDMILTSKKGRRLIGQVARREGLYDTTRDAFDRKVRTFRGIPIVWMGTKGDQTTEIIDSAEADSAGAGSNHTSFYLVRFGHPYVHGIQMGGPEKLWEGRLDDGVTDRIVWQWALGLSAMHERSIVRIMGVTPTF